MQKAYKVLIGSIHGTDGERYFDEVPAKMLAADDEGRKARVKKLLKKGLIKLDKPEKNKGKGAADKEKARREAEAKAKEEAEAKAKEEAEAKAKGGKK